MRRYFGTERRDQATRQRLIRLVAVGAGAVAVTHLVLEFAGVRLGSFGPFALRPLPALVTAGGVLAGPIAVVGTLVGALSYQFVHGVVAPWRTAGYLLLGVLVVLFWYDVRLPRSLGNGSVDKSAHFVVATVAASLWSATLVAWGYGATGQHPFFPAFTFYAVDTALSAVVLGGPVVAAFRWLGPVRGTLSAVRHVQPLIFRPDGASRTFRVELVAIPFGWFLLGSLVSVGFQVVERIPRFHFRLRNLGALTVLKEAWLFGRGGSTLLLAGGAICLLALVFLLRNWLRA